MLHSVDRALYVTFMFTDKGSSDLCPEHLLCSDFLMRSPCSKEEGEKTLQLSPPVVLASDKVPR